MISPSSSSHDFITSRESNFTSNLSVALTEYVPSKEVRGSPAMENIHLISAAGSRSLRLQAGWPVTPQLFCKGMFRTKYSTQPSNLRKEAQPLFSSFAPGVETLGETGRYANAFTLQPYLNAQHPNSVLNSSAHTQQSRVSSFVCFISFRFAHSL